MLTCSSFLLPVCPDALTLQSSAIGAPGLQEKPGLTSIPMRVLTAAFFIAFGLSQ